MLALNVAPGLQALSVLPQLTLSFTNTFVLPAMAIFKGITEMEYCPEDSPYSLRISRCREEILVWGFSARTLHIFDLSTWKRSINTAMKVFVIQSSR